MNKLTALLLCLANIAISTPSYLKGMSGENTQLGQAFDPFWFWSPSPSRENTNLAIPLPPLESRHSLIHRPLLLPIGQIPFTNVLANLHRLFHHFFGNAEESQQALLPFSRLQPQSSGRLKQHFRDLFLKLYNSVLFPLTNQPGELTSQQKFCFEAAPTRRELLKYLDKNALSSLSQVCRAIRSTLEPVTHTCMSILLTDLVNGKLTNRPAAWGVYRYTKTLTVKMPWGSTLSEKYIKLIDSHFPNLKSLVLKREDHGECYVDFTALANNPLADRLEGLSLIDLVKPLNFIKKNLDKLLQLKSLELIYADMSDGKFDELASSLLAKRLETLKLDHSSLMTTGFTKENLDNFSQLTTLKVTNSFLVDASFEALASSNLADQLIILDLSSNYISPDSLTVENFNKFSTLHTLILESRGGGIGGIGNRGFTALASSSLAAQLITLSLRDSGITKRSFTQENLNKFSQLSTLNMSWNKIKDAGFQALASSALASKLKELIILDIDITESTFTTANLNNFHQLINLSTSGNIRDDGFQALADSSLASKLVTLSISCCGLTKNSFTVNNLNNFSRLIKLEACGNFVLGKDGITALANSAIANNLEELDIGSLYISQKEFKNDYSAKFPRLRKLVL